MLKKLLLFVLTLAMGINASVFAAETPLGEEYQTSPVTVQELNAVNLEEAKDAATQEILEITTDNYDFPEPNRAKSSISTKGTWSIPDPVFVGNGDLTTSNDLYVVQNTSSSTVFLKLASSNPNLLAVLYKVNTDGSLTSTGFGVYANGSDNYGVLGAGTYAIVIGSSDGNARGTYTLMWNRSNPSGANSIIDKTSDLSRVVLFYNNNKILSNGDNIMTGLKWSETEEWSLPYGYRARDMKIDSITSSATYLGEFSSSAPYSTKRALFIEISRGSYLYFNSFYENKAGDVTHIMDWIDPSGLKTPRWLGDAATDFDWGSHYIVIDLNTFSVVEFLSPFNFHYTQQGGRTYTLTNISMIG